MTDMLPYPEHHASIISHTSDMTQERYYTRNISLECCAYRHIYHTTHEYHSRPDFSKNQSDGLILLENDSRHRFSKFEVEYMKFCEEANFGS